MRYIGRFSNTNTQVQIEPDFNSYVNVKTFGTAGLDRYFYGRVRGAGGDGSVITIGEIVDFSRYQEDYFKVGQEVVAFFFRDTSNPGVEFEGKITSPGITAVGNVVGAGLSTAAQLKYFIFAYNPVSGQFSPYRVNFSIDNIYKDPKTQFDEENYVRLSFSRANSNWLPVIYRQWGTKAVEFLGVLSNNILGSNVSVTFNDLGPIQIPSWDEEKLNSNLGFPEFLKDIVSIQSEGFLAKTIVEMRRLKVLSSSLSGNVEFVDAANEGGSFLTLNDTQLRVKFKFDDTKAIQDAIDYAASSGLKDVFFPSGTYSVRNIRCYNSVNKSDYNGITLRGLGESSVIKRSPSTVNPIGQFGIFGVLGEGSDSRLTGVTISGLGFDGNKNEVFQVLVPENDVYGIGDKYNDSIALEYVDSVRINNCSFYNGLGSAIYSLNSEKLNITSNRVFELSKPYELNISPIKIRESSKAIVQGNLFENCTGPVDLTGVEGSTVSNNIINNCGETGIRLNASENWAAQGNLAYNQSGSIIRSTDLYNNEYSRVNLDVKRGITMPPVYFTVTDGGLPVNIVRESIRARVYPLNSSYNYNTAVAAEYLQVVESAPQLLAGIFAITAPIASGVGTPNSSNSGKNIKGTQDYDLLNPGAGKYGYGYRITATVGVGKYAIQRIQWAGPSDPTKIKIFLRNSADILSLFFTTSGGGGDLIQTSGVGVENSTLQNWPDLVAIQVNSIDQENSAIVIQTPTEVASLFNDESDIYSTPSGFLSLIKNNYFIADGNIYVSD